MLHSEYVEFQIYDIQILLKTNILVGENWIDTFKFDRTFDLRYLTMKYLRKRW